MTGVKKQEVVIAAPNFGTAEFLITGTSPFVQNKFSAKARENIRSVQEAGSTGKKGKKKEPKDFKALYHSAMHISDDGWNGIPAPAFRNAMIAACRVVGFQMTRAKLSVFVEADGFDKDDGTPLVKITKGKPEYSELPVRLETGVCDIRPRPMWKQGWQASVRVRFDADQFTTQDVTNLLARAGMQVGVGEGRPFSPNSYGQGWGLFSLEASK